MAAIAAQRAVRRTGLPARRLRRLRLDPRPRGRRPPLRVPRAAAQTGARPRRRLGDPAALPRRLLRPPAGQRHGARRRDRGYASRSARLRRRSSTSLDAGTGLWLFGDTGTGKTTLAMLVSKAAAGEQATRSRSTRCRSCWRGSAGPTTQSPAETPTSPSSSGSPRSTCSTSTTSAPRNAPTGCSSSSTHSSTSATKTSARCMLTTNLTVDKLEEQIGSAHGLSADRDLRAGGPVRQRSTVGTPTEPSR